MQETAAPPVRPSDWLLTLAVAAAAALLLFANLGAVYLWQDEAATAVLGRRLLTYGKPLAYDGVNLITMDHFLPAAPDAVRARAASAEAAIAHAVAQHEFRADTAWTGQPWGQFLVAGLSLAAFGQTTLAARAPFAAAALLAVLVFLRLVLRETGRRDLALAAVSLLLLNAYWILHVRQCRYYALSSLALVLVLAAFLRWRDGRRFGAPLFVAAGFLYFQVDYGSFWPSLGALFGYAAWSVRSAPSRLRPIFATGLVLLAAVAPFVLYYELPERFQTSLLAFARRLAGHAHYLDRYVLALPLALAAVAGFVALRARLAPGLRRLLALALVLVPLHFTWIALTTPHPYLRYQIQLVPLGALLAAWVALDVVGGGPRASRARRAAGALALFVVAFTPLLSAPFSSLLPGAPPAGVAWLRPELAILTRELAGERPDPNRDVIEWIAARTAPGDAILVSYEDVPFMFYTNLEVRGGIAAFRVLDASAQPPRFAVLRRAPFLPREVFREALARGRWRMQRVPTPDAVWGNNPDPVLQYWNLPRNPAGVEVAERVE